VLFLLTFVWMPDSPYFLLAKGRTEDARKSLQYLRRMRNVDTELASITADVQRQLSEPGRMRDIFSINTNLKAFLILIGLRTFQQLSGISAIGFYTQVVFEQAGGSFTPAESAIICSIMQFVFACFSSILVDKFGRKPLFIFSSLGTASILIIMGVYFCFHSSGYDMSLFMWLPVIAMVSYYVVCASGLLMVPNLMTGELLSVSVKSKALGIINIYLGVIMAISSKLLQFLDSTFGMHVPFFVFGICCLISAIFCYVIVPETKGKTLEQIQQILKGNHEEKLTKTEKGNDMNVTRF